MSCYEQQQKQQQQQCSYSVGALSRSLGCLYCSGTSPYFLALVSFALNRSGCNKCKQHAPCGLCRAALSPAVADCRLLLLLTLLQASLDALRLALDPSTAHPIDVALVNGEVFMNLATAGPVSEVSSKGMSDASKKLLGPAAVAVAGERGLQEMTQSPVAGGSGGCITVAVALGSSCALLPAAARA